MKKYMVSFFAVVRKSTIERAHYVSHVDVEVPDDYKIVDYKSLSEKADPLIEKIVDSAFGADGYETTYHIMAFSRYEEQKC